MSAVSSKSPGGQPSITQPMAGPCDSPKEVTQNSLPNVLPDMGRIRERPGKSGRRLHEAGSSLSSDPGGSGSDSTTHRLRRDANHGAEQSRGRRRSSTRRLAFFGDADR